MRVLGRAGLWAAFAVFALVSGGWVAPAAAQSPDTAATEPAPTDLIGPPVPGPGDLDPEAAGLDAWASLATRVEDALMQGVASEFALLRLRVAVAEWRDRFLTEEGVNAARIATVTSQIAALGPPPEGDAEEEPRIAARRAELDAQLRKLRAPVRLAQEGFAHADGLVGELDAALRAARQATLAVRGVSPLDPGIWSEALSALTTRATMLMVEVRTTFGSAARRETFARNLPTFAFLGLLATVLALWGQRGTAALAGLFAQDSARGTVGARIFGALCQVAVPLFALLAVWGALDQSGLFGFRVTRLIDVLPSAGTTVIVAHWLAAQFFAPERAERSSLDITPERRSGIRRLLGWLGWLLATSILLDAAIGGGDLPQAATVVAYLPLELALAYVLFRLGLQFMRMRAKGTDDAPGRRGAVLPLFGRLLVIIAILGPALAALGYSRAADALIEPAVMTLALMGVVIVLQRLVFDIYTLFWGGTGRGEDALAPVLIGFVLIVVAVPVLALIWGVRVEELTEIWQRFREGYSLGESRIRPTDFITFALVFAVGYAVTRLVQSTLRSSILPRTRLDVGARTALVAGLGYVGIFAAALAAITSAGIDLSAFAIVAGALSVGIGFGLQNIVSNFISGIILLIERPISEGDWIEVGGQMGYVRAISVRSTLIETFDRTDVIVPNADLISGTVTNWTRNNSVGRVKVPVGVAYGTDTARVDAILREVAEANPMVLLHPPPNVFFLGFGADSMDFEIRAILRDINFQMVVTSEMNHAIAARFAEEGIEIPFAQRDIWLRNPEALRPQGSDRGVPMPAADDNDVHPGPGRAD